MSCYALDMRSIVLGLCLLAPPAFACQPVTLAEVEVHLAHINDARRASGLAPLALDAALSDVAQDHACDMADRGYFSHTTPGGRGLMDRARGQTGFCQLAENIARGQRDIPTVMGIWLRSTGHRANLLDPGLTHVGLGRAPGPYWVQVFGGQC
ncbi:Cysteine-rich secretory protein family protein [Roseibaca calidilacus]|uniref:Cysteine-rich secretory protein family protein n=2 Tax=Roseibaca calidilacus TaxID=1666912 RepID=A0ABM9VUQ2_9RHOB|nr:Cysteine-rich secretory protein family protein [Roseibaca calidilacus]